MICFVATDLRLLLLGPRRFVPARWPATALRQHRAHVLAELDLDVEVPGRDGRRRLEVVLEVVVQCKTSADVGQQVRVALLPQHAAQRLAEPLLEQPERRTVQGSLLVLGGANPGVCGGRGKLT